MKARTKIVLLVAVVTVAVLSAVVWKASKLLVDDKLAFLADSSMRQMAPLKKLVQAKLEENKKDLVRFASARESNGAGRGGGFGHFDVIALVQSTSPGQFNPTWIEKGANVQSAKWPEGFDLTLLKSISYAKAKEGQIFWSRLSDAQGTPIYAVTLSVKLGTDEGGGAYVVGFATENPLAGLVDDFIGGRNMVYLVDDRGYVVAHMDKAYNNGALFSNDPIVSEIIKGQRATFTGEFEDLQSQPVIGHYEKIDRTNLSAIITLPATAADHLASSFLQVVLVTGGGIGLIGLALAWLVGGTIVSPPRVRKETTFGSSDGVVSAAPAISQTFIEEADSDPVMPIQNFATSEYMRTEALRDERKNAYEAFQSEVSARLREPLLAVLGQTQLLRAKTDDEEVTPHIESIERETRAAKDALERFQSLVEKPHYVNPNETCDAERAVHYAISECALQMKTQGIEIESPVGERFEVKAKLGDISAAIEKMLENSIDALRDRDDKKIKIAIKHVGNDVEIRVEDNGVGMTRDVQERAFEPFFKGFADPRRMGLGLAFVNAIAKRYNGTCAIESNVGEGSTVILRLPSARTESKVINFEDHPVITKPLEPLESDSTVGEPQEPSVPTLPSLGGFDAISENDFSVFSPMPAKAAESDDSKSDGALSGFEVKIRKPKTKSRSAQEET